MTQNPILKVLSTFKKYKVEALLIGGQACIIYGAAEFSRDSDFVVLCDNKNLERLKEALHALKAEQIYVPQFELSYLERGHACHFRCKAKGVEDLRIDLISKLRGCEPFDKLWARRITVSLANGHSINIIGLADLVQSKKTQRDKDWFMLTRLVENDYSKNKNNPSNEKIRWWFLEGRKADFLIELSKSYPEIAKDCANNRPPLSLAIAQDAQGLTSQLLAEEAMERQKDVDYWAPLRKELEVLRHKAAGAGDT